MRFHLHEWIEGEENAVLEERATVASYQLFVGQRNVAAFQEAGHEVDRLTGSVYCLADGLADEWWRVCGSRGKPVTLLRYGGGYALPDIRFEIDGESARVWAEDLAPENPPITFAGCPPVNCTRQELEKQLASIFKTVIKRLQQKGHKATSLEQSWRLVQKSMRDPEEVAFCEAAGALHLDPYMIEDADADFIFKAGQEFSGEPLLEFLSSVRTVERSRVLASLDTIASLNGAETRLPDLRRLAVEAEAASNRYAGLAAGRPAWALGYQRAACLREALGLGACPEVGAISYDVLQMATVWLGASAKAYKAEKGLVGLLALRRDVDEDIHVAIRQSTSGEQSSQRFAFARALGDAVCFPDGGTAPVNDLDSTYRQAAGRAFAAEFLAPLAIVAQMSKDGLDTGEIADSLVVSPEAVTRQLGNATNIRQAQSTP